MGREKKRNSFVATVEPVLKLWGDKMYFSPEAKVGNGGEASVFRSVSIRCWTSPWAGRPGMTKTNKVSASAHFLQE